MSCLRRPRPRRTPAVSTPVAARPSVLSDTLLDDGLHMLALMMDRPLTLPSILEHAALYHGDTEVVTRTVEGPIHRYGYRDALDRAKRMANALVALGVKPGDRVVARGDES